MSKPLTERQAKNCEEAREPVCRCRCAGRFHGQYRGGADAPMTFYYGLAEDDPHYTPPPEVRAQHKAEKLEAKRKERDELRAQADRVVEDLRRQLALAQREQNYELASQLQAVFLTAYNKREEVYKQTKL